MDRYGAVHRYDITGVSLEGPLRTTRLLLALTIVMLAGLGWRGLPGQSTADAAFPGTNGKIAYELGGGVSVIKPGDVSGTPLVALGRSPAWSPDGRKLAYIEDTNLVVINENGSGRMALSLDSIYSPSWSPDGHYIAFSAFPPNSDIDLFMVEVGQTSLSSPVNITNTPAVREQEPEWGARGTRIAYVEASTTSPTRRLAIRTLATGAVAYLSGAEGLIDVSWSPDETMFAFTGRANVPSPSGQISPQGDFADVFVISATGGTATNITNSAAPNEYSPAWSPDGTKIAYVEDETTGPSIKTMSPTGSGKTEITSGGSPAWQPLPGPPIVFLHGFLGSEIDCGANQLWPDVPPDFDLMELATDGVSPAPGACAATVGDTVETFLGSSVYDTTIDFLNHVNPGKAYFFNWDWRKSPESSLALLDAFIDDVRNMHNNEKVVLMAHSYGGLLARWYIDSPSRADKVERVLTVGTPAWGAPKALFPLFAGIEMPDFSTLDSLVILDDAALKEFAENLSGNYFLFPSASYGPWLTLLPGSHSSQQGVLNYVDQLGGSSALLSQGLVRHASTLDAVATNVPFEVIVGAGLLTIAGVQIDPNGHVIVEYDNGDSTVPIRSAARGAAGTGNPNTAHTHYACGVQHVALPGDPQVTDAIREFLLHGDPIDGLPAGACSASGNQFRVFSLSALPAAAEHGPASEEAAGITPEAADLAGDVDYLDLPNEKIIVTGEDFPEMVLPPGEYLDVTRIGANGTKGQTLRYGPTTGVVTISPGDGGPLVLEDGVPIEGEQPFVSGDVDCNGAVNSVDGLKVLQHVAGLPVQQTQPCPQIGAGDPPYGDVNCDGVVNSGDALFVLRHVAGLPVNLAPGCPAIGARVRRRRRVRLVPVVADGGGGRRVDGARVG